MGPPTTKRNLEEVGIGEGARGERAHGELECLHCRSSPSLCLELGARTAEGPTMVVLGPLAITLLPPSLALLVFHLSSSQDVFSEPSSEQQPCGLREHPTVAFAGESHFPLSPFCNDHVQKDLGRTAGGSLWLLAVLG